MSETPRSSNANRDTANYLCSFISIEQLELTIASHISIHFPPSISVLCQLLVAVSQLCD